jgi:predicted nucleic acid-binding protein
VVTLLLDTNVLSELRKGERCDPLVRRWAFTTTRSELHTSVIVLGELKGGIERVRPKDPRFAAELERWLSRVIARMGDRILPVDQAIALTWGQIAAARTMPPIDGLLAATALVHGFTLVTRNVRDIAELGVSYLNPFDPIH